MLDDLVEADGIAVVVFVRTFVPDHAEEAP
jgi:hypothetical protein